MDLATGKEKAIERLFWGEDYERPSIDDTGELSFPFYRVAEGYKEGLLNFVKVKEIKDRKYKVIIDYSYGSASSIFPSILGELDCDTVAINAYIDDSKFTRSKAEFDKSLKQLGQIVVSLKADMGIMFDTGAEKIFIVDEKGRVLDGDISLSLLIYLVGSSGARSIAVPVTASSAVDDIAAKLNLKIFRTGTGHRAMMEAASENKVDFFGEHLGGYIFPGFQPSFDSMLSTSKLFELLLMPKEPMSEIVDSLPRKSMMIDHIPCPNALKGTVLRYMVDNAKTDKVDMIDGVKIHLGDDWVLVNGHAHRQEIYIISESADEKEAKKLLDQYRQDVKKLISEQLGKK
jgi:mannose-1-phosphate guanylyltransferase/phosphomannomutase